LWRGAKGILVNLLPFFWRLFWCPVLNTFHLSDTLILGMLVKKYKNSFIIVLSLPKDTVCFYVHGVMDGYIVRCGPWKKKETIMMLTNVENFYDCLIFSV
jgi:hypothetical protein